jgi:ABC-type transport system involved in multi-copper enzyme maturation permease subunit
MTLLPIVERELRLAARRKSTFRIRSWTAILAILICFVSMVFLWISSGGRSIGQPLFVNLTGYAFGLCLLAGVFLTSDSLSEEKREGTLGLLFLTDLHGYDVVLGKFIAMLLSSFYALLALLPITGLPLLLGGVTGGEFWRTALALANALFVSLTAGIWISSLVRDAQQAMGRALILILLLVVALPLLGSSASLARPTKPLSVLEWLSPFYPFSLANAASYSSNAGKFWGSLAASQALGWLFLVWASFTLPYRWQEGTVEPKKRGAWRERLFSRGRGGTAQREKARREFLPINPILWLVAGEKGFARIAWSIVAVWAAVVLMALYFAPEEFSTFMLNSYIVRPFSFLLKALFAVQVCRFFVESRRNGTLEMLLCTPLTNRDIIRGQALAMRHSFLWPLIVFIALFLLPPFHQAMLGLPSFEVQKLLASGAGLFFGGINAVRTVADLLALFWFGLWLALTMKKPNYAPALTILIVLILPSFLCWLDIFADLFFIFLGLTKIQQDLRWVVANQFQAPTTPVVPPTALTGKTGIPPIIPQERSPG